MKPGIQILYAMRWVLLILGSLCLLGISFFWLLNLENPSERLMALGILAAFFFSQYLFLRPGKKFFFKLAGEPRPMKLSIALLSIVMVVVNWGVVFTLVECMGIDEDHFMETMGIKLFWTIVGGIWLLWALFFYWQWRVCTYNRYSAMARVLRFAIAGTLLELITSLSAYATVKDPDNCYCARGSFLGLCLGIIALCWLFGPGIVLLFLYERQKRTYQRPACQKCFYDLRGSLDSVDNTCPECGTPFDRKTIEKYAQMSIKPTSHV